MRRKVKNAILSGLGLAGLGVGFALLGKKVGQSMTNTPGSGTHSQSELAHILADQAVSHGFPGWWFVAIALWEGRGKLKPDAINDKGPDAARGNAWGLMQITLQTARAAGFQGEGRDLLDPNLNAYWAGEIVRKGPFPGSITELASLWNSGRLPSKAPQSTLTEYVPGVLNAQGQADTLLA